MQKSVQWLGMALLVPFVLGCGGSKPYSIVPVEGTLMMDGKPIDKIAVRFVPIEQGPESTGISDAQGHFVLHTTETKPEDGAVIGQHKVLLTDTSIYTKPFEGRASEGVDLTEGKSPRISIRYRVLHGTPLEVSVSEGTKALSLDVDAFDGMDALHDAAEAKGVGAAPAAAPAALPKGDSDRKNR